MIGSSRAWRAAGLPVTYGELAVVGANGAA